LECVIGGRGITIQLPPSGLAKLIILKPIYLLAIAYFSIELKSFGGLRQGGGADKVDGAGKIPVDATMEINDGLRPICLWTAGLWVGCCAKDSWMPICAVG
jgi:hypothetical protein